MARKISKSGVASGYLHGYSSTEQKRLVEQARFLESSVYAEIDFTGRKSLLEVGCGVGAQTEILLRRFPHLTLDGVDASAAQVRVARKRLARPIRQGRVRLATGDALQLPYKDNAFDSAFVCWLLEHVREPVGILKELRRVLQPGARLSCTEVLNSSLFVHPYSPATLRYWFAFNDHQWNLGGDPFVGAKLGNYLQAAGFQNVVTRVRTEHYDNRMPKRRAAFIEYWITLLLSGASGLIKAGKISSEEIEEMRSELSRLKDDPDSVFFYSYMQAHADVL